MSARSVLISLHSFTRAWLTMEPRSPAWVDKPMMGLQNMPHVVAWKLWHPYRWLITNKMSPAQWRRTGGVHYPMTASTMPQTFPRDSIKYYEYSYKGYKCFWMCSIKAVGEAQKAQMAEGVSGLDMFQAGREHLALLELTMFSFLLTLPSGQGACVQKVWEGSVFDDPLNSAAECDGVSGKRAVHLLCDNEAHLNVDEVAWVESDQGRLCGFQVDCSVNSNSVPLLNVSINRGDSRSNLWMDISNCEYQGTSLTITDAGGSDASRYSIFINASHNSLRSLSDMDVRSTASGIHLDVSHNAVERITSDDLSGAWFETIVVLIFHDNAIKHIEYNVFRRIPALQYLDVSYNALLEVPHVESQPLPLVIRLDDNIILNSRQFPFNDTCLVHLDLSTNQLSTVRKSLFSRCVWLKRLSLADNHVSSIESGAFAVVPNLQEVNLARNQLTEVSEGYFANATDLRVLILSVNSIRLIQEGAFACTRLEHLDLSANDIKFLTRDMFNGLSQLISLDLSHNDIDSIGQDPFGKMELRALNLSHNPLRELPASVFHSLQLESLGLAGCLFRSFPGATISQMAQLKEVNLSRNAIDQFPSTAPGEEHNVERLDLSGNDIKAIGCVLLSKSLTHLYLHNNAISTIEGCLAIKSLFAGAQTTLSGNPLDCCTLQWLRTLWNRSPGILLHASNVLCAGPEVMHLVNASTTTFSCTAVAEQEGTDYYTEGEVIGIIIGTIIIIAITEAGVAMAVIGWRNKKKASGPKMPDDTAQEEKPPEKSDRAKEGVYIEPIGSTTDTGQYEPGCQDPDCTLIHTEASELPYIEMKSLSDVGRATARRSPGRHRTITAVKVVHATREGEDDDIPNSAQTTRRNSSRERSHSRRKDIVYIETVDYASDQRKGRGTNIRKDVLDRNSMTARRLGHDRNEGNSLRVSNHSNSEQNRWITDNTFNWI